MAACSHVGCDQGGPATAPTGGCKLIWSSRAWSAGIRSSGSDYPRPPSRLSRPQIGLSHRAAPSNADTGSVLLRRRSGSNGSTAAPRAVRRSAELFKSGARARRDSSRLVRTEASSTAVCVRQKAPARVAGHHDQCDGDPQPPRQAASRPSSLYDPDPPLGQLHAHQRHPAQHRPLRPAHHPSHTAPSPQLSGHDRTPADTRPHGGRELSANRAQIAARYRARALA